MCVTTGNYIHRYWQSAAMLQNLFGQSILGAGNSSTSGKQEDGAGAALFRVSIVFIFGFCSFDRCPQAHRKTKKKKFYMEDMENSLHQKLFIWQRLALRTGNPGKGISSFGFDGVMRGSRWSCLKVTLGKWPEAMQCSAVIQVCRWFSPEHTCDDNWLGCWSDPGQKEAILFPHKECILVQYTKSQSLRHFEISIWATR